MERKTILEMEAIFVGMGPSKSHLGAKGMLNDTYNVTKPIVPVGNTTTPERKEELVRVEVAVQAAIFALAILGNCCVLVALCRRRKKSTRMHIFIMHLSIADLQVAFFNILPQLIWDITHRWYGGDFLCRFIKYSQIFVMYLSTYILVMTAVDRYRAICHPLSNHTWTPRLVHVMIGGAYAIAAIMSLPQLIMFKYQETKVGSGVMDCWVHFDPPWTLQLYITSFTVFVYLIPFVILLACYGSICYTVWRKYRLSRDSGKYVTRDNVPEQMQSVASQNGKIQNHVTLVPRNHSFRGFSRAKLKTVKLTFVIILAYIVCWSPFFVSQLWWLYDESAPLTNNALVIMLLLASLNSCCNPWIYLAFSGNVLQTLAPCKCTKMDLSETNGNKLCVCTCSEKQKKKQGHKQKWTFRSTYSCDSTQSLRLTTYRKDDKRFRQGECPCNTNMDEYFELHGTNR
ncbi:cephalotocin receptor 2-like [Ylistrum balloti]|uniref:cephalotocin receptor 2-like n=1 Tax=Ylistrum balloti TaxID=509963 RepID=UPI002905A654|nr:cephalotocin receptor 2-like [Ylistrum balloti]